jgi:Domain of unknown function (DUF4265)
MKEQYKIVFQLEKDEDGYPPNEWETMWADSADGALYVIDNIPFFVRDISYGDVVSVIKKEGRLHFDEIIKPSLHSVIRVIVFDESKTNDLRHDLKLNSCDTELSHVKNLIAVDIPPSVDFDSVLEFLDEGEKDGLFEYEISSCRHPC